MDNQKAIKVLQNKYHIEGPASIVMEELEARELAIAALEKQKPYIVKKDGYNDSVGYHVGECRCGAMVRSIYNYCNECGQSLDWER